jgi:tetratricopeptide (TPR) repeat protein
MRTRTKASKGSSTATSRHSEIVRLQERLAFRLLLVFTVPLVVIVMLGIYAYRLSSRLQEVEVLEHVSYVDRIYTKTHNVPWAREEYQKLADRYKRDHRIFVRLGALYHEDGQPAQAIELVQKAIALKPDAWEAYSTLAYILLSQKADRAAIAAGEKAIVLNNADVQAYNNLAWIYATSADERLRDTAKALTYAEKAVRDTRCLQPSYLDTLAEIYRRSGRVDEATQLRAGPTRHPLCDPSRVLPDRQAMRWSERTDDGTTHPATTATLGR